MADELETIATYSESTTANLARNQLLSAGLRAFLVDESTVNMAWHLNNALGGIKLQVPVGEAAEACALLAEVNVNTDEAFGDASGLPPKSADDDLDMPLSVREQNADRAFRAAVLGIPLPPLQPYASWLLIKIATSEEPLSQRHGRTALFAALINVPAMLVLAIFLRSFFVP